MANLGVNIALDPKPHMSKAYYTKEISELKAANQAQAEKLEAQEAKLDAQAKQMNEQSEQIKALMQRLAALEGK